jgi:outer membrane protein TolC
LGAQFNALRSISPLFFQSGGSTIPINGSNGNGGSSSGGDNGNGSNSIINLPQTINSLSQNSGLSFSQLLPTGQTFSSTFNSNRSSGNSYSFPITFGNLSFSIAQPLLQNWKNLQARGPINVAKTQLVITSEQSEAAIGTLVARAARQYWDAIQARDNIRVQQMNVDLAQKSYDRDKLALQLGALAKLDILQSQTQVAERNRELVQSQYSYRIALDGLRQLIGADLSPELRNTEIVLEDDPSAVPPKSSIQPFEEALANSLKARPEAKAVGQMINVDKLNARIARDALLPKLDLSVQGGSTGPGLDQVSPGGTIGIGSAMPYPGIGETLHQIVAFDFPSYGFGLQLTFPFRNSAAKANLADSLVDRARDEYRKRQTQQQITLDVRQAINAVELADALIGTATQARDLAQKNVAAEQQKYELGSSTAFELLDSQTRLATAESALLNAYVTYQQAYIDYQRATWTLLDGFGMIVEIPKRN